MLAEHIRNSGRQAKLRKFFLVYVLNHVFRISNACSKAYRRFYSKPFTEERLLSFFSTGYKG